MRGHEGQLHFLWTHTPVATLLLLTPARAAVLNWWVATPLGGCHKSDILCIRYLC